MRGFNLLFISPLEDETPPDPESSVFFLSPGQFRGKPLFVNLNKVDWEASSSNILRRSGFFPPSESAGQEEGWPAPLSAPSPSAPHSPGPSYARDNPVASFSPAGSPSSTPRPHQWYGRYRYWAGYQERLGANRTSSRPTGYQSFTRYPSKVPARAPENILARPYPTKAVPARPRPNPSREAIPAVRNPSLRPPAAVGRYPANTPTARSPQPGRVPPGSPQGAAGSSRGPSYPLGWSMSSLALSRRMFLSAEDSQASGRDVERQVSPETTAYLTSGESWHSSGTGRGAGRDVRAAEASLVTEGMVEEAVRLWGAVEGINDCRARALCRLGSRGRSSGAPYVLMAAHRFLPRAWEDRVVQVSEGALLGSDCQQWACGRDDVLTR
ncbi:hypothetical protein C7M84_008670 [Penaeus vannamei]|uniref:Uncharacterized protein n=1 Tax=Penaeus vannamei TaxID=6689 RepID=A0A3R7M4T6_PENVA|nr:hypothetical protein C7M84_008670 [Penaeus vannamei]